jgi:hypothetical protein
VNVDLRFVKLHARTALERAHARRPFAVRKRPRRATLAVASVAGAVLALLPSCAGAQGWRTVDVARMVRDTMPMAVRVAMTAGTLRLTGAEAPYLYRVQARYDEARSRLHTDLDTARRSLALGLDVETGRWSRGRARDAADLAVALTRRVPVNLSVELGATQGTLDLTGVRLRELAVRSGASETTVRWDAPSAEPVDKISFSAGAAAFHALGLAHTGVKELVVTGGVGFVELDFGGPWRRDITLDLTLALGGGAIAVPADVGVRVTGEKTLGSYELEGLVAVGPNAWETRGFASAKQKLVIKASTTVGQLKVTRR